MIKYMVAFSVYTLAMIGVIVIAFLVWKNAILNNAQGKKGSIKIEETLNLNSRKTLYVIKIKNERFLIAADVDKTTFLAKLQDGENILNNSYSSNESATPPVFSEQAQLEKQPTMRNILKELTKNKVDEA